MLSQPTPAPAPPPAPDREMIQEEAAPILAEVKRLRAEVAELHTEIRARAAKAGG